MTNIDQEENPSENTISPKEVTSLESEKSPKLPSLITQENESRDVASLARETSSKLPPLITSDSDGESVSNLSGLQQAGVNILRWVGSVGLAVILLIFVVSFPICSLWMTPEFYQFPIVPEAPQNYTEDEINRYQLAVEQYHNKVDDYERAVDIYQKIGKAREERAKELFQAFIVTAILPTFTSILGYIFGTSSITETSNTSSSRRSDTNSDSRVS